MQSDISTEHTALPWVAGYPDGSGPTCIMTVATREKFAKVGIRGEYKETATKRSVTLTRDDSIPPRSFGQLADIICEMYDEDDIPKAVRQANASLIVRAVNNHEALLAALERLTIDWEFFGETAEKLTVADAERFDESCRIACAAIEEAKR